jgi:hypothetical protein
MPGINQNSSLATVVTRNVCWLRQPASAIPNDEIVGGSEDVR